MYSEKHLPPKFAKSVVKSVMLKFQSGPNEPSESLEEPMAQSWLSCNSPILATSDVKVVSSVDASRPIPDISDGVNGKWLFDATDAGLAAISDKDDMAPHGAVAGVASGLWSLITMLQ